MLVTEVPGKKDNNTSAAALAENNRSNSYYKHEIPRGIVSSISDKCLMYANAISTKFIKFSFLRNDYENFKEVKVFLRI